MVRLRHSLFVFLAAAGLAGGAGAETPVGGRVVGPDGRGLAGVRVALEPVPEDFERVAIRLDGDAGPPPEAEATTDADGYFELLAPRLGAWKVVVPWGTTGYVVQETILRPLHEPAELPDVELRPASTLEVRVLDADGAPADARIGLSDAGSSSDGWRPRLRLARTGEDGVARLAAGGDEEPRLEVLGPAHPLIVVVGEEAAPKDGRVEIRLPGGVAGTVTVVDARGRRVAGAVAYQEMGIVPLGRTDGEGRLRLTVAPPENEPPGVNFLTADGRRGYYEPRFTPDGTNEAEVVVEPLRAVRGRVVDRESRDGVAGALVWAPRGPTAVSDARGNYELRLFPSRQIMVLAVAEGYAPAFERKTLDSPESEDGPTLALEPAAAVSGTVVDSEGRPVAGVDVTAEALDATMTARYPSFRLDAPSARSTRAGRFFLSGLSPAASYALRLRKPGYAPARHQVDALRAFESRSGLRIVLDSGVTGVGRVVDGAEAPVAGAEVRLVPVEAGDMRRVFFRARLARRGGDEDGPTPAVTDSEGRFRLPNLAPGRYHMEVEAAGFAPAAVPGLAIPAEAGETDLGTVVLAPGVRVEGAVRDPQGAAVADAEVFLAEREAPVFQTGEEPAARSDAAGRFTVADLEPGKRHMLVVSKAGFSSETANVLAGEGATVEVVLRPAGTISGRVRNEDGDPVAEAAVFAQPEAAAGPRVLARPRRPATTDEQGAFRSEDVEPGDVELTVGATGYQRYQRRGLKLAAGGELRDLEIVLLRGATVVGTVTRRDGSPVVEADVTCSPAQEGPRYGGVQMSGQTDGEGRYRIDGLAPGPAVVSVQRGHFGQVSRSVEVGPGTQSVDLVVDEGFAVSGRVTDSTGFPVAGASLSLIATDVAQMRFSMRHDRGAAATRPDGTFTLEDVDAGRYLLTAAKDGYASASTPEPFEVAGPVAGLELELRRGATLRGRVLGLELDELAGVVVRAFGITMGGGLQQGIVDYEGRYSVPNLGPGDWHVTASDESTGRQATGQVTVGEAEAEVELDLEFKTGFAVDGVVTSAGQPQSGVYVHASGMDVELAGAQARAVTGSDGRFRLSHLPAGKYHLTVMTGTSPHSQGIEVPAAGEIVVEIGELRLSGHVRGEDGATPLPGAAVRLERVDPEPDPTFMRHLGLSATETDSNGYFSVNAQEGLWRLIATRAGYAAAEITVDARPGGRYDGLELRLTPTEGVTFEVLTETGETPSQVAVAVLDAAGRVVTHATVPVGEGGTARLSTVPPGPWDLAVQSGESAVIRTPIVAPGHVGQIVLRRGGVLKIKVPELAGQPALSRVALTGPDGRPHLVLESGVGLMQEWPMWNGESTVPQLAPGVWSFTVTHPDGRTWTGQGVVTAGETSEAVVP